MYKNKIGRCFTFLILLIFLISFTSAMDFDNFKYQKNKTFDNKDIKDYKLLQKYKPIEIKNLLGLGSTLFEGYLSQHDDKCGSSCQSTIEIKLHKDGVLIDNVIFKTLQEDNSWIEQDVRSYQFYISTKEKKVDVDDYEYQCEITGTSENGTEITKCNNVKVGSHKEDAPEWTLYNLGDNVDKGIYKVKLEAEKKPSRTVDWVIKTNGEWLESWAMWGGTGLNNGTIAYYKLDNNDFSDELGNYDGTNEGTSNTSGILIDGRAFVAGDTDDINIGLFSELDVDKDYTINMWVSPDLIANQALFSHRDGSNTNRMQLMFRNNEITARSIGSTDVLVGGDWTSGTGTWAMVTLVHHSDNSMELYENGNLRTGRTETGATPTIDRTILGASADLNDNWFDGGMDEVGVWNRTLSTDEILELYNSGDAFAYPFPDNSYVTLNSPSNNSISDTNEVEFNCSAEVIGGATLTNMSLWTNESGSWEAKEMENSTIKENIYDIPLSNAYRNSSILNTEVFWVYALRGGFDTTHRSYVIFHYTDSTNYTTSTIDGGENSWANHTNPFPEKEVFNFEIFTRSVPSGKASFILDGYTWGNNHVSSLTQTFNRTLTDTTLWTCQACDSDGDCGFANENRTLSIDTTAPTISIESPTSILNYNSDGGNETLNVTFTDTNLESCWYSYNGTNTTIDGCQTGIKNSTQFSLQQNIYNVTVWANDSVGNINSTFIEWSYEVFEINQTFNSQVVELSSQSFELNSIVNGTVILANLFYNGTSHSANIFNLGGGNNKITSSFQIPSFSIDTNVTFYYNITMSSGSNIITPNNTQEVINLVIGNCTTFSNLMFNLSLFDEKTLFSIDGTMEVDVEILNTQDQEVSTKSTQFFNVSNALVCSNINLTEASNLYNLEVRYYVDPSNNSNFQYAPEFYHIQKAATSNLPQSIDLYDLNINQSTEFTILYRDNNYISKPNVLLQVLRKYVDEGIFRVVEIPITSSEGSTIAHFDLNNYKYKIIATENGEVLNVFDNPAISCESELSGICTLSLNGKGSPNPFEDVETTQDIAAVISTNETEVMVVYSIPSGETKEVTISMVQSSPFQDTFTICNQTISSSAGSISCTLDSTIGDSQVLIRIDSEGILVSASKYYYQEDLGDFFLLNNYAIGAFFIILLITMMVSSPKIMVLAATFSVALLGLMFLIKGSSIGLLLGSVTWLIIAGILILIKINKKDES